MDYDDNDFQSQNLHLASEGSSKFPPALRPYALSKFDFDESLQGHLRFDSLVEPEVFLGIESNEDNQWSGIVFSSSAAESCSISRHNNVWSEAASSESVEMLLKSVGQEEFIPRQTVIEESNTCDELACLVKQMEPNTKSDDKNTVTGGVAELQPIDRIHENLAGFKEDAGRGQSQARFSGVHDGEVSIPGSVYNSGLSDICPNVELPVPEGSCLTDGKSNNSNKRAVETVADESLGGKIVDDPSVSGMQTCITASSMQNISSTYDVLSIQNVQNQVIGIDDEKLGALPMQIDKQDMGSSILNKDSDVDNQNLKGNALENDVRCFDNPHCSDSKKGGLEGGSTVDSHHANVINFEESSDLEKTERCSEVPSIKNLSNESAGEDVNLHKDAIMDDQSSLNAFDFPNIVVRGDSSSEGQVVEINNSNSSITSNLNQDVNTIEANKTYGESSVTEEKELSSIVHRMDEEIVTSKSEEHMSNMDDNNSPKIGKGNCDSKVGGFCSLSMASSPAKSCILGEATEISGNNEVDRQDDHETCHQNVAKNDKESIKVHSHANQMNSDVDESHLIDKGVGSSSHGAGTSETELPTSTTLVDDVDANESASQVISENTGFITCEKVDISPLKNTASTNEATDDNDVQKRTHVESVLIDEKQQFAARTNKDAGISPLVGSSERECAPSPLSGTENQPSSHSLRQETANSCLQVVGTSNVKTSEPQETPGGEIIQDCTETIGFSPVLCESGTKKDDQVTDSFDKHEQETLLEDYEMPPSKVSVDALLSNKGSASVTPLLDSHVELHEIGGCPTNHGDITFSASTAIGSLSQTEKDGSEVQASADKSAPVSEFTDKDPTAFQSVVAHDPKGKNEAKADISLTCVNLVADLSINDVTDLTTIDVDKVKSVPAILASKSLTVVEGSPSTSGLGPKKTKGAGDVSHGSPKVFHGNIARGISKATPERKTRRASQKTSGKESSRKRNKVKEATPVKQSERVDKSSNVSLSPPPGFQLMQTNEVQQYGRIDSSSTKQFALLNASTSSLPDLNTSAPAVLFQQQPFTDLQQVQLRAQIFVYGALIQGTAPDEAYMISAFGGPDGGRSMWEKAWHACMERQNGQKSQPINQDTPQQSRSGHKPSESAVKQSALQGKGISSPLGRASTKAASTIVNSPMPLSSPLWSVPTPSCDPLPSNVLARGPVVDYPQAFASMHPYQTPPLRNFVGHNTPWVSQSPLRGPWIASPTPVPDNNSHPSASPVSDAIKLISVKGSSLPPPSGVKTPGPPVSSGGPPSTVVGTASLLDTNNVTPSNTRHSSDPKPKKRKKPTVPEDLGQKALQLQSQLEATPAVSSHVSTPVAITTPAGYVSKTTIDKSIVSASPLSPASQLKNDRNVEKRILSDESLAKVKEARVHAEEAAALSAASVSHSLEIWNQLDKQKNSGLVPDIEAKLASAAVAIAAAASVAKAAAAAANVASNAALQAKMMADEALASSGYDKSCQSNGISLSINLGKATPASILKGDNVANSSSSIMLAAKEAVRRKVEAASAATQRAENMDAIVKAAELAVEAVSQAGKIVTMGDHLPLSDLVKAGPEGYWKTAHESSQQVELLKDMARGRVNIETVGGNPTSSYKHNRDISSDRIQKHTTAREKPTVNDVLNETSEDHMRSRDGISSSITIDERDSRGPKKGQRVSNSVNSVGMVPEIEMQSASVIIRNGLEKLHDSNIKEGSLVEIFKDGEGFKEAWFTANVLSLNDNKAYVCYNVLLANEGSGPLKEWVSLEGEEDKPPRMRIARPLPGLNYEGTRKRRRAAMGDYAWSVGNRVDAWIQESWREGVVIEKSKKDETTLTVHFPAHGETSVVKAWQLRPSLAWKDGKWIDSSSVEANDSSTNEGDTPHEKRPRFNSPAVGVRGKDKMSKSIDAMESVNPDELRLLDLTENEKVFNIGKNSRNENKSDTQRMPRTGLQKEGSRVIFGVPKPGKKRKFMEVSKHYVADKGNKINDGNDSVKLANFLVPQGLGTRGWKTSSKNDGKEKRGPDSKLKTFRSGKPLNVLGRTIPQKDSSFVNTFSHPNNRTDRAEKAKDFGSHSKNASESESQMETASYSESDGAAEGPTLYSSLATSTDASSKKTSTSRASKGKLAPAGGKLSKIEEEKTLNGNSIRPTTSEAVEPRRSNRRIQPTSRLLEGLQSSLIISKIPSVSHDKGHKNQNRNASRGNNQG